MSDLQALLEKGAKLYGAGRSAAAARVYREAAALAPENPTVRLRLALALWHGEHRAEAALAEVEALAAAHPDAPAVHYARARILNSLGRFEAGWAAAERALALDPEMTAAWLELVAGRSRDGALEARLREALARATGVDHLKNLHFALAAQLRAAGEAEAAFDHAACANAFSGARFDVEREAAQVGRLIDCFDAATLGARSGAGDPDPRPVFVFGAPRSGTTLAERLLAAHPEAAGIGETTALGEVFTALTRGVEPAKWRDRLTPADLAGAGAAYLKAVAPRVPDGAVRFVDKMPANHLFAPFAALALPNAALIHVTRDRRDVGLSCFEASFAHGHGWASSLPMIGTWLRLHERLTEAWRERLGARWIELRYEDLATDPEAALRPALERLGLGWDPACATPAGGVVHSASLAQARERPHGRSIGRWRRREARLGPLLAALGER